MAQGGWAPLRGAGWAGGKPSSVPPRASRAAGLPPRGDGHPSRTAVSRRLQRPTRAHPGEQPGGAGTGALLGLAPGGVYLASRSPGCRWALTPPFHLCRREARRPCLSVALSLRFPSPGVTRRPALRSSDFPRPGAPGRGHLPATRAHGRPPATRAPAGAGRHGMRATSGVGAHAGDRLRGPGVWPGQGLGTTADRPRTWPAGAQRLHLQVGEARRHRQPGLEAGRSQGLDRSQGGHRSAAPKPP